MIRIEIDQIAKQKIKKVSFIIAILIYVGLNMFGLLYLLIQNNNLRTEVNSLNKNNIPKEYNISKTNEEVEIYKQMVENMNNSNDKILSTVYWSLGGIAVAIFGVIGTNVFFNFRFNKKEVENMKENFSIQAKENKNDILQELQNKINSFIEKSRDEIREDLKAQANINNTQIENVSKNLYSYMHIKEKENNKKFEDILSQNNSANTKISNRIDSINNSLEKFKNECEIDLKEMEGNIWSIRGVTINALNCYIEKGISEIEKEKSLVQTLGLVLDQLSKIRKMNTYDYARISEFADQIPKEYNMHKEKIISAIKEITVD